MKKSGKLASYVADSNIAIDTLPTLQISVGIIALFEKIYEGDPIFTVISNIGEVIRLFKLSVWCEKFVAAQHYAVIWKQLLIPNDRNRVRWAVLGLSQDGVWADLFENINENSLKRDQSNDTKFNPPLFSLVKTFNVDMYFSSTVGSKEAFFKHIENYPSSNFNGEKMIWCANNIGA